MLLPKYLPKVKIVAPDKFSEAAVCKYLFKIGVFKNFASMIGVHTCVGVSGLHAWNLIKKRLQHVFSCKYCEIFMNSFFYRIPLVAASEKYEYTVYMLDLLNDCCNCFLLSLIEKHLNEPIMYNFSFLIERSF